MSMVVGALPVQDKGQDKGLRGFKFCGSWLSLSFSTLQYNITTTTRPRWRDSNEMILIRMVLFIQFTTFIIALPNRSSTESETVDQLSGNDCWNLDGLQVELVYTWLAMFSTNSKKGGTV